MPDMFAEGTNHVDGSFEPTDEHRHIVKNGAAFGVNQERIAKRLEIDAKTLRKYFRKELEDGSFVADMTVGQTMYELTQHKDPRIRLEACKWWTARRMGWTEPQAEAQNQGQVRVPITGGLEGEPMELLTDQRTGNSLPN